MSESSAAPSTGDLPGLVELLAQMSGLAAIATGKGENAGQSPMLFLSTNSEDPLALDKFKQVQGDAVMGLVNWTDLSRLLATLAQAVENFRQNLGITPFLTFGGKHGNVCGGSVTDDPCCKANILQHMIEGDPIAIFGGFVIVNFGIDKECADAILRHKMPGGRRRMIEGVIAPSFTADAMAALKDSKGRCKLLVNPALADHDLKRDETVRMVQVRGGWLAQKAPTYVPNLTKEDPTRRTNATPTNTQVWDMLLADAVCRTSNSNTITVADRHRIVANGVSQQSRVAAAELAIANAKRAGHDLGGATAVSDSFFPFTDGPDALIKAGITCILASSGSTADADVTALCSQKGVTFVTFPDDIFRGFSCHIGM